MSKHLTWDGKDVEEFTEEEIESMSEKDRDSFYVRRGFSRIINMILNSDND